jgi:hypothetical protein
VISGPTTQPDPASTPLGSVVAGRYQIARLLGEGGFGAVFEAYDRASGGRVALKIISASVLHMSGGQERFQREVDVVRRISHPNIVRVVDAGLDDRGTLFIAFELLEGHSLEAEIEKRGALQPRRVAHLASQVLAALEAAHGTGVVHRDIKPANVFLVGPTSDLVKLLDFGIAKSTNPQSKQGLTKNGMMLGTPAYMPPEQLFGKTVGPATDLFAFGIVMAEMLNGRSLYADDVSPMTILQERIHAGRVPIPESVLATPLGEVIARATKLDQAHRYQSAGEMRAALEGAASRLVQHTFRSVDAQAAAPVQVHGPAVVSALAAPQAWAPQPLSAPPPGYTAPSAGVAPVAGYTAPGAFAPHPPGAHAQTGVPNIAPLPVVKPKKASGGGLVIGLVVAALAVVIALGVFFATRGATPHKPRRSKVTKDDEATARAAPDAPISAATPTTAPPVSAPAPTQTSAPVVAPPPPVPGSAVLDEVGTSRACSGLATLTKPTLRARLKEAGLPVKGDLLYCAGDMINFQCKGPEGRGFTVSDGAKDGSAALFKLPSPADAEAFAKKEALGKGPLTVLYDGSKVLLLQMSAAAASSVSARVCK